MPVRKVTCGVCAWQAEIPDQDWNHQKALIDELLGQHEMEAHGGDEVPHQIDPSPLA